MGGTDYVDQLIEQWKIEQRQTQIYAFSIWISIANAHILFKYHGTWMNGEGEKEKMSASGYYLLDFIRLFIKNFCDPKHMESNNSPN